MEVTDRVFAVFQSPYGGIGASDEKLVSGADAIAEFQSPYGGKGTSDILQCLQKQRVFL